MTNEDVVKLLLDSDKTSVSGYKTEEIEQIMHDADCEKCSDCGWWFKKDELYTNNFNQYVCEGCKEYS